MSTSQPLEGWLIRHGFTSNPFASKEADFEAVGDPDRFSSDYFVNEYWFSLVVGDWRQPRPAILHAARGAGKSATRLALEYECRENSLAGKVLTASYLDFEKPASLLPAGDPAAVHAAHLKELACHVTTAIFDYLRAHPLLLQEKLTGSYYDFLAESLISYSLLFEPLRLEKLLQSVYAPGLNRHSFEQALHTGTITEYLDALDPGPNRFWLDLLARAWQIGDNGLQPDRATLSKLHDVLQQVGLSAIFVLVDRVDELPATAGDPQVCAQMLAPFITDLRLLETPGYGFKFFIPTPVFNALRANPALRPDRLTNVEIHWTPPLLKRLLVNRLRAYSRSRYSSLGPLCNESLSTVIDDRLAELSGNSPRNLLRLGELLISSHVSGDNPSDLLSLRDLEQAVEIFRAELHRENTRFTAPSSPGKAPEKDSPKPGEKGLRLSVASHLVWVDGERLAHPLVGMEFDLLAYLYARAGRVVSKGELIRAVYGEDALEVEDQRLAKLVQRVRDKLEPRPPGKTGRSAWQYIITIPREGYKLENRVPD